MISPNPPERYRSPETYSSPDPQREAIVTIDVIVDSEMRECTDWHSEARKHSRFGKHVTLGTIVLKDGRTQIREKHLYDPDASQFLSLISFGILSKL